VGLIIYLHSMEPFPGVSSGLKRPLESAPTRKFRVGPGASTTRRDRAFRAPQGPLERILRQKAPSIIGTFWGARWASRGRFRGLGPKTPSKGSRIAPKL
jgi:hypothetical protein